MKKLLAILAAGALVTLPAASKGLEGKVIYVNAGHGGWTTGDRPTPTINYEYMDTLGFFESKTNLWKALELQKKLEADGAKVIMRWQEITLPSLYWESLRLPLSFGFFTDFNANRSFV